jgi:IclR family transcriptional regulator, pca regulon regulatory protein
MSSRQSAQSVDDYDEEWISRLTASRYSQSLERGLAILDWFRPEDPVQGIADIADGLGMSRSTTHRYVITLVALGFMEQLSNRKYRLRLRVTDLGMSSLSSTGLRVHARPYLEELRRRTTFTTSLAVLDGTDVLYVDRARSLRRGQNKIDRNVGVGSRLPAYCTALGKVLLAGLPKPEQREIVSEIELVKRGPHTITSKKALYSELARVSEDGVAVDDEEFAAGFVAAAVPVRDERREVVAAASLAAHTSVIALEELVDALGPHLVATADHISARLGYRRDDEAGL